MMGLASLVVIATSVVGMVKLADSLGNGDLAKLFNPKGAEAATPCIITVFGVQYDVASLRTTHSGGDIFQCGTDMSATYQARHGTDVTRLRPYRVTTPTPTFSPTPTPTTIPTLIPTLTPTPTSLPTQSPIPTTTVPVSTPTPVTWPTSTPTFSPNPTVTPIVPTLVPSPSQGNDDEDEDDDDDEGDGERERREERHKNEGKRPWFIRFFWWDREDD